MFGSIIKFAKDAGEKMGFGKDRDANKKKLKDKMEEHGLSAKDVDVEIEDDKVVVTGKALSQEEKEKLILVAGNVEGIESVEDKMEVAEDNPPEPSNTHTVKRGDTLWAIAKAAYGDGSKYPMIFEANKPMLSDPDKIYPGQVLRIPPLSAQV